jgi:hypothetical protein
MVPRLAAAIPRRIPIMVASCPWKIDGKEQERKPRD